MLEKLFTSKTRVKILWLFFSETRQFHLREIAKKSSANINAVRREANNLESLGILLSEKSGNMKLYFPNEKCPILEELRSIFLKEYGIVPTLRDLFLGEKGIKQAFIYGSYAKGGERPDSDIDLMIIGDMDDDLLLEKTRKIEKKFRRQINYIKYGLEEFDEKKKEPFLSNVLNGKKIMIVGGPDGNRGA